MLHERLLLPLSNHSLPASSSSPEAPFFTTSTEQWARARGQGASLYSGLPLVLRRGSARIGLRLTPPPKLGCRLRRRRPPFQVVPMPYSPLGTTGPGLSPELAAGRSRPLVPCSRCVSCPALRAAPPAQRVPSRTSIAMKNRTPSNDRTLAVIVKLSPEPRKRSGDALPVIVASLSTSDLVNQPLRRCRLDRALSRRGPDD